MSAVSLAAPQPRVTAAVYDADDMASLLDISKRQVWRLRDAGLLPPPIRLGTAVVKWSRAEVDRWIAAGCPRPKRAKV